MAVRLPNGRSPRQPLRTLRSLLSLPFFLPSISFYSSIYPPAPGHPTRCTLRTPLGSPPFDGRRPGVSVSHRKGCSPEDHLFNLQRLSKMRSREAWRTPSTLTIATSRSFEGYPRVGQQKSRRHAYRPSNYPDALIAWYRARFWRAGLSV